MKLYILPILLQMIGFLVIIAEVFIPSLGLLTAIALGVFFYSLYIVYTSISTTAGMVLAGLDIVLVPVLLIVGMKILARSPLALKRELSKQDGVVSQKEVYEAYINMKGRSVTDLRPAGMAEINSQRVDVVTDGEYIDADTPIVVTDVAGNRIIVEQSE
ncbi:MAG: serine protease [Desulfobacula sp.]|uniref:NfeD family protein n=1 Tax=Desulfobacula sp. TaxID=2593537 RepID=UPI0025C4D7A5|nr:NfeD family protein [Desulfobacula sp.]MCD4722304.1 serine protease [Desulfobacula sp.]